MWVNVVTCSDWKKNDISTLGAAYIMESET